MPNLRKNEILICPMTEPRITQYLTFVSAIVTDEGGLTSHAAIASRELRIPCVIGTKVATRVFRDGDLIEVDGNKGTVKKIK